MHNENDNPSNDDAKVVAPTSHDEQRDLANSEETAGPVEIAGEIEDLSAQEMLPPPPTVLAATDTVVSHEVNPAPPPGLELLNNEALPQSVDEVRSLPKEQSGGIEFLIQMAEKGEIDPKNIDIIDVTDRFLKAIAAAPKENLRQSGKIIFQASILLRMKAEALLVQKFEDDFAALGDDYVDYDENGAPIIYDSNLEAIARQITLQDLERALTRQTKTRQLRHRRVTLEQLIEALREAERIEKKRTERKVKPVIAIDGYMDMEDVDDLLELAHDEDIESVIVRLERLMVDALGEGTELAMRNMLHLLHGGGRGSWVDGFLAVLFLANAGKLILQQEEFYAPLFITRGEHLAAASAPESGAA